MIDSLITLLIFVVFSILVGRAVMLASGRTEWTGTEPAVGYATMVAVGGLLAILPGHEVTLELATILLAGAGVYAVVRLRSSTLPRSGGLWIAVAISLAMVLVPFVMTGRWGFLGMGFNNDLGLHLSWAQWLTGAPGTVPDGGYPLGPHGLVAGLAGLRLVDLGPAFIGQIMAMPILLTMTGYAAMSSLASWRRIVASVLIGLPYLIASFYAQAAFKEVAMALFILAFVVLLPEARSIPADRRDAIRLLVPFVILTLGAVFTFSFPALAFIIAILAVWIISDAEVRHRLNPKELVRMIGRPMVAVALVAAVVLLAALTFSSWFGFISYFLKVSRGTAFGPVSPVEALGVWLSPDYRLQSDIDTPFPGLMGLIGGLALAVSVLWWMKRPRSPYPLALIALVAFYLLSLPWAGDYSLAKALTIMSPVVMVVILSALLDRPFPSRTIKAFAWTGLATVFVVLAFASSLLALRDASVGPSERYDELEAIAPSAAGSRLLFGDQDRFGPYYLPDSKVGVPLPEFPDETVTANPDKPFRGPVGDNPIDFDSFDLATFRRYPFFLTSSAAWSSLPRDSFEEVASSPSWILWQRKGPVGDRSILEEYSMPAARIDCSTAEGRQYSRLEGTAVIKPETVVANREDWEPGNLLRRGQSATVTLDLGKGRWQVSMQYFSPFEATLSAPGYRQDLIPSVNGQRAVGGVGPYWPAGVIDVGESGRVKFEFEASEPTFLQKAARYGRRATLGRLALTRDEPHRKVPMSEICGEWVDYFEEADTDR